MLTKNYESGFIKGSYFTQPKGTYDDSQEGRPITRLLRVTCPHCGTYENQIIVRAVCDTKYRKRVECQSNHCKMKFSLLIDWKPIVEIEP